MVDTTPPVATPSDTTLWPPNHKMHEVALADCVSVDDVCDPTVRMSYTYATSDEMPDVHGSGNTAPDVEIVDCGHVLVRAERSGGGDGRVYRLGYEAIDHAGNRTTGSCRVLVPHDQSGSAAVEGAEAYRVAVTSDCSH